MTITAKKIGLIEQQSMPEGTLLSENYLGVVGGIEVECLVRLGTLTLTINELRELKLGQQLILNQRTQEPVDVILNNQVIARGELMSVDECFAIQITEVSS